MNTTIVTDVDTNEVQELVAKLREIKDIKSLPSVTLTLDAVSAATLVMLAGWHQNRVTPEADTPENRAKYAEYVQKTVAKDANAEVDTWEIWRVRNHSMAYRMLHDVSYVQTEDGKRKKVYTYNPKNQVLLEVLANIAALTKTAVAPLDAHIIEGLQSIANDLAMEILAN